MKSLLSILIALGWAANAQAQLHTEVVEYKHGDTVLEGFLAYDEAIQGKRPGVLVVHAWMGLGPYAKKRAEQLAALGYIALAIDMYGKGVRPKNAEEAAAQCTASRTPQPATTIPRGRLTMKRPTSAHGEQ